MARTPKARNPNHRAVIAYQREAAQMAKLAQVHLLAALVVPEPVRLQNAARYQRESARYYRSARQLLGIEPNP